jgi:hypothetical protein
MQLKHFALYEVRGLNTLTDAPAFEIMAFESGSVRLVMDPEPWFAHLDRSAMLGNAAFVAGLKADADGQAKRAGMLDDVVKRRRERHKGTVYLVVEADGGEVALAKEPHTVDDVAMEFDLFDDGEPASLQSAARSCVAALVASLPDRADLTVSQCGALTYGLDGKKPIYSFTIKMGWPTVSIAMPVSVQDLALAPPRASALAASPKLQKAASLLVESLDRGTLPLRAFIAAWSALEIFLNVAFKERHHDLLIAALSASAPALKIGVVPRIEEVMVDKYRLADKFAAIAAFLTPDSVEADLETFSGLKKERDAYFHGDQLESVEAHAEEAQSLLRRYLGLELDARVALSQK